MFTCPTRFCFWCQGIPDELPLGPDWAALRICPPKTATPEKQHGNCRRSIFIAVGEVSDAILDELGRQGAIPESDNPHSSGPMIEQILFNPFG